MAENGKKPPALAYSLSSQMCSLIEMTNVVILFHSIWKFKNGDFRTQAEPTQPLIKLLNMSHLI